ncbi:hypothetical protein [Streptomyces sp. NPDC002159]
MKLKTMTRAAVVATGVAVAGLSLAIPASATEPDGFNGGISCTKSNTSCYIWGYPLWNPGKKAEGQIDNTPGNGAASWIWIYGTGMGIHMDYYLQDDSAMHQLYTPANQGTSTSLSRNVTAARICGPNGLGGDACTSWSHPAY